MRLSAKRVAGLLARQKRVEHRMAARPVVRRRSGNSPGEHQMSLSTSTGQPVEGSQSLVDSTEVVSVYGKVTSTPKEKVPPFTPVQLGGSSSNRFPVGDEYNILVPNRRTIPAESSAKDDDAIYDTLHEMTTADRDMVPALRQPPFSNKHRKPRSVSSPEDYVSARRAEQNEVLPPASPVTSRPQPPSPKPKPKRSHKPPRSPSIEEPEVHHPVPSKRTWAPSAPSPTPKPRRQVTASESAIPEIESSSKTKSLERMSVVFIDAMEERKARTLDHRSLNEVRMENQRMEPFHDSPHLSPSPVSKKRPVTAPKPQSPDSSHRRQPTSPGLPPRGLQHSPAVKPKPNPTRQRAVTSHGTSGTPLSPPWPLARPRNYTTLASDSPPLPPKPVISRKPSFTQP